MKFETRSEARKFLMMSLTADDNGEDEDGEPYDSLLSRSACIQMQTLNLEYAGVNRPPTTPPPPATPAQAQAQAVQGAQGIIIIDDDDDDDDDDYSDGDDEP
jgi:hypothetical protein